LKPFPLGQTPLIHEAAPSPSAPQKKINKCFQKGTDFWYYSPKSFTPLIQSSSSGSGPMHKKYALQGGKVVEVTDEDAAILVFHSIDDTERRYLIDTLKIDEHTLGSALDPEEVGRVEFEPEHVAVIFKRPKRYTASDNFLFKVTTSGFFLFANRIVIVGEEHSVSFEGRPFTRVNSLRDVFLRLLFQNIQHFTEHLKVMNVICDELEAKVNKAMENKHLLHMFTIEKGLVYYLNAISSNSRVLEKLRASTAKLPFGPEELEYLDDLLIENSQCSAQANNHAQVLASLMDARASLVSNNLNVMMKNLNAIVIAVAVPSFISSLGGMSEFSTIAGPENWKIAYPLFITAMIAVGTITFMVIRKVEKYWR
jgi:magnesium transporter